jgi:hypothetical protein
MVTEAIVDGGPSQRSNHGRWEKKVEDKEGERVYNTEKKAEIREIV